MTELWDADPGTVEARKELAFDFCVTKYRRGVSVRLVDVMRIANLTSTTATCVMLRAADAVKEDHAPVRV